MRKYWLTVASLALVVALLGTAGGATDMTPDDKPSDVKPSDVNPPDVRPPDFNLIFKYGYGEKNKNVLDTIEGTYTWDMVVDPSITVELALSEEEMDRIYQKMIEIGFFDYPDEFSVFLPPEGSVTMVTPYMGYYFKVEYDSKIKELWWEDKIVKEDEEADKLRALIKLFRDIIEPKEEYSNLPHPRGVYQ